MINISQQKDLNSKINELYKLISKKMEELNEIEYELDTSPIFVDMTRPETNEPTYNQQLATRYNRLNKLFDDVNRTGLILAAHYNKPEADYPATLAEIKKFSNFVQSQLRSL